MLALKSNRTIRDEVGKKDREAKEGHSISTMIFSLLLVILAQSPAMAPGQQAIDLPNAFPSSLISSGTGKIVGSVRLIGRFERSEPLIVQKNRNFCGSSVPDESFIVHREGGIKNVVITIRGAVKTDGKSSHTIILDNKDCKFVPHVQVAQVGSEVLLKNSDPILHDVHARLDSRTLFNVGLPGWRQVKKRLTREGIVAIECEVLHTWMSAFIVVTSSPYSAVTDEQGQYAIEEVPVGNYQLEWWHERLGRRSRNVKVEKGHSTVLDMVIASPWSGEGAAGNR